MKKSFYVIAGTKNGEIYQRWIKTDDIESFAFGLLNFGLAWSMYFKAIDYNTPQEMRVDMVNQVVPVIRDFYHTNTEFAIDDVFFDDQNPFNK